MSLTSQILGSKQLFLFLSSAGNNHRLKVGRDSQSQATAFIHWPLFFILIFLDSLPLSKCEPKLDGPSQQAGNLFTSFFCFVCGMYCVIVLRVWRDILLWDTLSDICLCMFVVRFGEETETDPIISRYGRERDEMTSHLSSPYLSAWVHGYTAHTQLLYIVYYMAAVDSDLLLVQPSWLRVKVKYRGSGLTEGPHHWLSAIRAYRCIFFIMMLSCV